MAIACEKVFVPGMRKALEVAFHKGYYHTSFFGLSSIQLIKETPLLKWYKCNECGESWKEHKYSNGDIE